MELNLTDKNFETEVIKSDVPVLVDFFAPWCGPCQMLGTVVDKLAAEVSGAKVAKLNVDENPDTAAAYDIMSIPTIKIFKGGKVVKEFNGVQSKDKLKEELESA
ncbi:MAG: thioredoxin [Candidatus Moranbacteria bacterium]|nr:thioredoxin [Candidatus Moranbacteria bacterium]